MFKWLLLFLFVASGALAQNVSGGSGGSYCPTLAIGSNGNVCASTAFVVNSLAAVANNNPVATPINYGAVGDGVTDDTVAVQAALNGQSNKVLDLSGHIYAVSGVSCNAPISVIGSQGNQWNNGVINYATFSGLRPTAINQTTLTINSGCQGSIFQKFSIDSKAQGNNTSGAAIYMVGVNSNITFEDISINGACIGVDLNGNTIKWERGQITQIAGSGCGGMRIGLNTVTGNTVDPRISNLTIQCNTSNPADFGMELLDAGGPFISNVDAALYCKNGTVIKPGTNQIVSAGFIINSPIADTTTDSGLVIDTSASSAQVVYMHFNNDWTAAYTSTSVNPSIWIKNTGGGVVEGIHFLSHRILAVPANGMTIGSGVGAVTFDNSRICGANQLNSTYVGIELASGVKDFAMRGNTISAICDNVVGHNIYQVKFDGSNSGIILTDNNLMGWSISAVSGKPIADANHPNIIKNNAGIDDQLSVVASAATIDPGVYPMVGITGTTTVSTINSCWNGNTIMFRTVAAVPFATGGNISNALTSVASVPVIAQCQNGFWYLK